MFIFTNTIYNIMGTMHNIEYTFREPSLLNQFSQFIYK